MPKASTTLFFFIAFLFCCQSRAAIIKQDSTKKQLGLIVKADVLLGVVDGERYNYYNIHSFACTAEKLFCKRHSIQLTINDYWSNTSSSKISILSLIPEYKFFVTKKNPYTNYYIGAYVRYTNYYSNYLPDITKEGKIGGGISNGIQFYFAKVITLDVLVGVGIINKTPIYQSPKPSYNSHGGLSLGAREPSTITDLRFAINIGYRF